MESVFDLAREDTQLKKVAVNEYAGPCPACQGRDRFHVNLTKRDGRGGWMCRVCRPAEIYGWGDDVDYLVAFRAMSKREALQLARAQVDSLLDQARETRVYAAPDNGEPPKAPWQEKAALYVDRAIARLWSSAGRAALEYARGRGLQDATIKAAQLGFSIDKDQDGNTVPYLVIPWHLGDQAGYWAVNRRDMREDKPDDAPRYKMLFGSSKQGLYGGALLERSRKFATFMVEGEIDALILAQEARGLNINVVATGGQNSILTRWAVRLARMPLVLLAQDNEERGNDQAQAWKDVLQSNARRYKPLAKDVNEMLKTGWSVRTWVEGALDLLPDQVEPSAPSGQTSDGASDMLQPDQTARVRAVLEGAPDDVIEDVAVFLTVEMEDQDQAATWLEKARVAWSSRDSAALYALAEEITYPGNLFLSRAGLQLELPTTSEQDAGAAFIDHVSALVASSGAWPDGFALRLVDDTFAARIHALPDRAKPVVTRSSLEALPRKRCPGLVLSTCDIPGETKKNRSQVAKHCPGKPLANGWCEYHQRAQLLLDMGAALDYPRIELDATAIGAGRAHWESFACYANTAIKAALPRVKRLYDQARKEQRVS